MDNSDTINILCATDENYAPYCGIMLTSLFESNRDCRFVVYVFTDVDFSETNKKKYNKLGKKYGNIIHLMKFDNAMIEKFPITSGRITRPTYYRLLATELLPKSVHKVIYLDCDLVVVGDIKPLWNVNFEGKAIAGVSECYKPDSHCDRLEYSVSFDYFNAGVLVMNLEYWKENDVFELMCRYSIQNVSKLKHKDQDVLNGTLFDKKQLLPARYNFVVYILTLMAWESYSEEEREYYLDECSKIVVVHYAGIEKPWNYRSYGGPFFSEWEKYRRKSLWRGCRNTKPFLKHVKHLTKRYVFPNLFRKQRLGWVVVAETKNFY